MPTVPVDSRRPSPDMPVPSETDFMMALATMKDLGRIPFSERLDPSLQGQIEDRRGMMPGAGKDWLGTGSGLSLSNVVDKILPQPSGVKRVAPSQLTEDIGLRDLQRASIGVSGGSR